jgi:hypothetical protein
MEHRWGKRRPANVTVRFVTLPAISGWGRILDISSTGAFLATDVPLRRLSVLYLQPVDTPADKNADGRIAATVVRQSANGFGLEWCEFAAAWTPVYAALTSSLLDLSGGRQMTLLEPPTSPVRQHFS